MKQQNDHRTAEDEQRATNSIEYREKCGQEAFEMAMTARSDGTATTRKLRGMK